MTQQNSHLSKEFSLRELLKVVLIVQVTLCLLYISLPYGFFPGSNTHAKRDQSFCASNMKQVGFALIGYTEDYDGKFPPAIGKITLSDNQLYEQQWGLSTEVTIAGKQRLIPSLIDAYLPNKLILRCPLVKESESGLTYLYNDFAAGQSQTAFSSIALSVLCAEGEDHLRNVGHAKSPNPGGEEAILSPRPNAVSPKLLLSAAVGNASIRHSGGANYLFAEGHVKWTKPDTVYFPPRTSNSTNHREPETGRLLGPDPGGKMTYQGKIYKATFHLQ